MKPLIAALAIAAALAATAAPAPAATPSAAETIRAKAHFKKGEELYRRGRYPEAIAEFEAAYRLRPHGVLRFNIAQCHERLGDLPAALRSYRDYLREVPKAEDRETVLAAMAALEGRIARKGVQQLAVYTEPAGAEVWLDGQVRGKTPFTAELPPGNHSLSVTRIGYETVNRLVTLPAERALEIDVALAEGTATVPVTLSASATPTANPNPNPNPPAAARLAASAPSSLISTPVQPPPALEHRHRRWTWIAAGAAGAALAAGVAYGLAARSASADLAGSVHDQASAQRLHDEALSRARTANILYGAAAVAGATGTTLFFVEGKF